jgi:hypothetical protein
MLKNPTNTMDPYAGIATNEECQQLFVAHMRVLQDMPKIPAAIMVFICGYCKTCQKYQRLLWDLYAGIARHAKNTSGYYGIYMRVL